MTKRLQHYVDEVDSKLHIPASFEKFINKQKIQENIILKQKSNYFCTNCKNTFISNIKINEEARCPKCKNKYVVRRFNLKNYETKKDLILLDKLEDIFVLRVFELYSIYRADKKDFEYLVKEYRRVFFDDKDYKETVESDSVFHTMGLSVVCHWKEHTCWRRKLWNWYYNGITIGEIFTGNIKKLLKGTKYQYTQLWKVIPRVDLFDIVKLFQNRLRDYHVSFELLAKLKLYNLALECNKFGNGKMSFEQRFGVPKEFLPFMQKNNITYNELSVLKVCKTSNIRLLRALEGCYNLTWLSHWVDLYTAWKKGLLSRYTESEYADYLKFAIQLDYNMKDKKILYPKNLKQSHDKLQNLVEIVKNEANDKLLNKRYEQLKGNIYKTKKYIIFPARSTKDFIIESEQQHNCVKTYIEDMALNKSCDIYFMREDLKHSLVTVEVRNNKIVQAKIKYNEAPTKEQMDFLKKWEQKILNKGGVNYAEV